MPGTSGVVRVTVRTNASPTLASSPCSCPMIERPMRCWRSLMASRALIGPRSLLRRRQLVHHPVEVEARGLLSDREVLEALEPLSDDRLRRHEQERALRLPLGVLERLGTALERIGPQVIDLRDPVAGELALPDAEAGMLLLLEGDLPVLDPDGEQIAVVAPVEELLAGRFVHLALEEGDEVEAVEVDLERLGAQ